MLILKATMYYFYNDNESIAYKKSVSVNYSDVISTKRLED